MSGVQVNRAADV